VGTEFRDHSSGAPSRNRQTVWLVAIGIGSILTIVGWFELGAVWISADLGNLNWEFDAIAKTFRINVLPTIGLGLVGVGLLRSGYDMGAKVLAIVFLAIAAFLTGILTIYIVDLPDALQNSHLSRSTQESQTITTFALAAVLIGFYGIGAWYLRSRTRKIY
jgi:hypothetical protein